MSDSCAIARTLAVVGERWTLLILRDAFLGATRFSQFRRSLGIAPDVLTDRLATLVTHGVLSRETYREEGSRAREEYRLTDAGRELQVVLGALQQWGDATLPWPDGPTVLRCGPGGDPLHVGFVDDRGEQVDEVRFLPARRVPREFDRSAAGVIPPRDRSLRRVHRRSREPRRAAGRRRPLAVGRRFGAFTDVMVERPDGHRVLLAPDERVGGLRRPGPTAFDEVRLHPRDHALPPGTAGRSTPTRSSWSSRPATAPRSASCCGPSRDRWPPRRAWITAVDVVARRVLPGVRHPGQRRTGAARVLRRAGHARPDRGPDRLGGRRPGRARAGGPAGAVRVRLHAAGAVAGPGRDARGARKG